MIEVTAAALQQAIAARAALIRGELDRLKAAVAEHHEDHAALRRELADAWQGIGEELVPSLDPTLLDELAGRLAEPRLRSAGIIAAIAGERDELARGVAELDAERARRGDRDELDARIAALEAAMTPHGAALEAFDQEPEWAELFDHEYGTPIYGLKWWMFRYYRHRRQADAIVSAIGPRFGVDDFDGLRRRYLAERAAREALARQWEVCTASKAGLENIDRGRKALLEGIASVEARHLARARRIARERLRDLAVQAGAGGPGERPTIVGIEAKGRLLSALFADAVQRPMAALRDLLDVDERDLSELERGRERVMAWDVFTDTYADPRPAWAARRGRYEAARRRLLDFRDYAALAEGADPWGAIVGDAIERPPGV